MRATRIKPRAKLSESFIRLIVAFIMYRRTCSRFREAVRQAKDLAQKLNSERKP